MSTAPDLNGTLIQDFHGYLPADGSHWQTVKERAQELAAAGFTALWLPPACKGSAGQLDLGYEAYDRFDRGEFEQFEQKGAILTQYGTHQQYLEAIAALQAQGMQVYADAAVNHREGGGATATSKSFDNCICLDTDHALRSGCDLDYENEEVQQELLHWGKWYLDTTGVDGFRLDPIKPIASSFFVHWLDQMRHQAQRPLFVFGDCWTENVETLHWYINATAGRLAVFDVPLHYNFHRASRSGGYYDMSQILAGSLMQQQPTLAVTFVENHESQPLRSFESVVEPWFKPIAYAIILLRREGYPCVFYADYYGANYGDRGQDGQADEIRLDSHRWLIDKFLYARSCYAHGDQYDYFDHPNVVGWTRLGNQTHPQAMAVLLSDSWGGSKWMEVGKPNAAFYDLSEHIADPVYTNEHGWGQFHCKGGSVSVWLEDQSG